MAQPLPEGLKHFEPEIVVGETAEQEGSIFRGYAPRVNNLDEVRGTLDELLSDMYQYLQMYSRYVCIQDW